MSVDDVVGAGTARLGVDDAGEVLTLQLAAWVHEAHANQTLDIPALHETLDVVRVGLADPALTTWGYRGPTGRLLGMVRTSLTDRGVAHLGRLGVAPDVRGTGVGSALLRLAQARLPDGVGRIELVTGDRSADNHRFYERHGYVRADLDRPPATVAYVTVLDPSVR